MSAKRALIVDDSKSARAFLARILEQHGLSVDASETAEEALEYLARHRPDVIFMDHLMPGMDGLQAVRLIKNDPRTATVPILMYTSQEGELYLSQARALGAIGVLPKQTHPGDVAKALYQLKLIPERRREPSLGVDQEMTVPVTDISPSADLTQPSRILERRRTVAAAPSVAEAELLHSLPPDVAAVLQSLLRDHAIEVRRVVSDHLNQHADRIVGDLRLMMRDAVPAEARAAQRWTMVGAWLTVAALLLAGAVGLLWYRAMTEQRALDQRLSEARTELASTRQQLDALAAQANAPAVQTAAATGGATNGSPPSATLDANAGSAPAGGGSEPATGQSSLSPVLMNVPFGEAPLAGARVLAIRNLLERWQAEGLRGQVQVHGNAGRFCLASAPGEAAQLAAAESPQGKCLQVAPVLGAPTDQSAEFSSMLAAFRAVTAGAIDVQVSSGSSEALVAYPPLADTLTAGDWNRIAAQNNRVEVRWIARP